MSPEEAVQAAVDNARLEGVELDEEFKAALLLVAKGELGADVLVAQLVRAPHS